MRHCNGLPVIPFFLHPEFIFRWFDIAVATLHTRHYLYIAVSFPEKTDSQCLICFQDRILEIGFVEFNAIHPFGQGLDQVTDQLQSRRLPGGIGLAVV